MAKKVYFENFVTNGAVLHIRRKYGILNSFNLSPD